MENAITSKWRAPSKTLEQEVHIGRRLASLYGSNTSSRIVKKRSKKEAVRKKPASRNSPHALMEQGKHDPYATVTFLAEPSTGGPANPAVLVDPKTSPPLRHRRIPMSEQDDVKSRVSAAPKWKRSKVQTSKRKGWYVGNRSATGCPSPSFMARVPRYGLEGTMRMAQRERPAMFSPIGREPHMPKFLHRIPTSNVWSRPLFGSPGSWPKDAGKVVSFKEANSPQEDGREVVTARNLPSVLNEEREVELLYRSRSMERTIKTRQARTLRRTTADGTSVMDQSGRGARSAISSKRRDGSSATKAGRMK